MNKNVQPARVDTTGCLCKVSVSSLKITVSQAKKYVLGSKLCLKSDIKPSIHRQKPNPSEKNRNRSLLVPGLPDDLAVSCIIRVPRHEHRNLRLVCKKWYRLLRRNLFYSSRKSLGIAEEWVYVLHRDRDGKISWYAFDPVYKLWQSLPPVPEEFSEAKGFGCIVLNDCHLYLFGGKHPLKGSMRRVVFYNAGTNKWHRASDMLHRRHFFNSCVINNRLYVAGGDNEGVRLSLRWAEVYDPDTNQWSVISDISPTILPLTGVVYDGKWYLKGLGSLCEVLSEVYDPESDTWFPICNGMIAGWRNPSVSLKGKLYSLDCVDGCKIWVYDKASDSWSMCMNIGNSNGVEVKVAAVVAVNGNLCIVHNDMSVSLVDVSRSEEVGTDTVRCLWERMTGKGEFKFESMMSNVRASITGMRFPYSDFVYCQVLQA